MKSRLIDDLDSYYVIEYDNRTREMYSLLEFDEFKSKTPDDSYTLLTKESVSQEEAENILDKIIPEEDE